MSKAQDILEEARELIEEFCEDCRLRSMTDIHSKVVNLTC